MLEQVKVLRRMAMSTMASHKQKVSLVRFGIKNEYVYSHKILEVYLPAFIYRLFLLNPWNKYSVVQFELYLF